MRAQWQRLGRCNRVHTYREMSGKLKNFQGQGIVSEFYVVSVKNGYLLKCQGNVREFYNFQFVSNDGETNMLGQFS